MKYQAKPVIVDAFRITNVEHFSFACFRLTLVDGQTVIATPDMTARYIPVEGDYWVLQADGYVYLNPKDVFERKYSLCEPDAFQLRGLRRIESDFSPTETARASQKA